jgi:transcriptional regulator with XRE-family HTH domain
MGDMEVRIRRAIGYATRQARLRANLTQREVAGLVGLVPEVYGRIERGQMTPSVGTLCRVCRTLDITPSALLGFAEAGPPEWWQEQKPQVHRLPHRRRRLQEVLEELDDSSLEVLHKVALLMRPESRSRTQAGPAPGHSAPPQER